MCPTFWLLVCVCVCVIHGHSFEKHFSKSKKDVRQWKSLRINFESSCSILTQNGPIRFLHRLLSKFVAVWGSLLAPGPSQNELRGQLDKRLQLGQENKWDFPAGRTSWEQNKTETGLTVPTQAIAPPSFPWRKTIGSFSSGVKKISEFRLEVLQAPLQGEESPVTLSKPFRK